MNTITDSMANLQVPTGAARSIGDILVSTGRLSASDAERILQRQQQDKSQFGDAALAL